jgi:hypothetical protein
VLHSIVRIPLTTAHREQPRLKEAGRLFAGTIAPAGVRLQVCALCGCFVIALVGFRGRDDERGVRTDTVMSRSVVNGIQQALDGMGSRACGDVHAVVERRMVLNVGW